MEEDGKCQVPSLQEQQRPSHQDCIAEKLPNDGGMGRDSGTGVETLMPDDIAVVVAGAAKLLSSHGAQDITKVMGY